MAERELNVRYIVDDAVLDHPSYLLEAVGNNVPGVLEAVELKNDGFGHFLPDEDTRYTWRDDDVHPDDYRQKDAGHG